MINYRISIITVCFNAKDTLEKTIKSVINQTYNNIEYIIIDGGSTDGSLNIIAQYSRCLAFYISEKDNGIYDAMNKGIKRCTGEWTLFLNSGDILNSDDVLNNVFCCNYSQKVSAIYGNWINDNNGKQKICNPDPFFKHSQFSFNSGICHQSVFFKTTIISNLLYNTKYRFCADYDLMIRVYNVSPFFEYINVIVSIYETSNGLSAQNRDLAFKECAMIVKRMYTIQYFLHLFDITMRKEVKRILKFIDIF